MRRNPAESALEVSQSPAPLFVDIKSAARILGVSIFAVRNLCWHRETRLILKPVRQGLKFLFSPVALNDFAAKLVSGEVHFPAAPTTKRNHAGAKRSGKAAA